MSGLGERTVKLTQTVELPDGCIGLWRLMQLSPLQRLAVGDESGSWHFHCSAHGTWFSSTAELAHCPTPLKVEAGTIVRLPMRDADTLLRHKLAETPTTEECRASLSPDDLHYVEWLEGKNDDYDL